MAGKKLSVVQGIKKSAERIADRLLGGGGGGGGLDRGKAARDLAIAQAKQESANPEKRKLKKGGKVSKPRGVGVAQRGYGKALTGKKK
jgi:hypothetical protein